MGFRVFRILFDTTDLSKPGQENCRRWWPELGLEVDKDEYH